MKAPKCGESPPRKWKPKSQQAFLKSAALGFHFLAVLSTVLPMIFRLFRTAGPWNKARTLIGYDFINGSMERHEFRFPKILDWIRQHLKPLKAG
jgi:hypothetical protein